MMRADAWNPRWVILVLLPLGLASVSLFTAAETPLATESSPPDKAKDDAEYYELFREFVDTMDQIERNYVKDITRRELFDAAIEGMLSRLDMHSDYIPEEELDDFKTGIENKFGGIGIQITPELAVSSPLYGTPAYKAGIKAGDKILEVDGESAKDWDIRKAVEKLKGEPGSKVTLKIAAPSGEERTVTLRREVIHIETVHGVRRKSDDRWSFMLPGSPKIGYIRVRAFAEETDDDLRAALSDLKAEGLEALVLDLRFNPGGLLSSAIEVSDLFIDEGLIVSTQGRNTRKQEWRAKTPGTFRGFPMVVLVNRSSASASEIVAAALQDHQRAKIAGERTWGKGSVQNVVELEGRHSALKLTTSSYHRPNGKNIDRVRGASEDDDWGVRPDEELALRNSERELFRLFSHLESRDAIARHDDGASARGNQTDDSDFNDRQLEKALEFLKGQIKKN